MFRLISVQLPYVEIELKNPSLNDSEQYDTNLRFARTRHNEPKVARDDGWPVIQTRNYIFEVLTSSDTQKLIDFLVETASKRVYMVDYNDEVYIVLITNTEYIITTARDDCNYNIPLDVLILESDAILPSPSPCLIPSLSPSP